MKVGVGAAMLFLSREWKLYRLCQEAIWIKTTAMSNLLTGCLEIQMISFAFPLVWMVSTCE